MKRLTIAEAEDYTRRCTENIRIVSLFAKNHGWIVRSSDERDIEGMVLSIMRAEQETK
jgi:hypothetical protein